MSDELSKGFEHAVPTLVEIEVELTLATCICCPPIQPPTRARTALKIGNPRAWT
jgi:hypothetical protein